METPAEKGLGLKVAWVSVEWIGGLVIAYLIGCIPSAYLAGRLMKGKDIREEGDRNPGAGNVYRTIGPKVGLVVAAADLGKGAVAVLIARGLTDSTGAGMVAGVAVVAGHNWPIVLRMRGGRGAASALGVLIALVPMPALPLSVGALLLLPIVRSATLGIGLVLIPLPFLAWFMGASYSMVGFCIGLPIMVGLRHYYTSRKLQSPEEGQAGEQVLPQG